MAMREIQVNLDSIVANYRKLQEIAAPAKAMAVVKANAYGHGIEPVALALDAAGVDALGVADLQEALLLKSIGIKAPILCWLMLPSELLPRAIEQGVQIGVSNFEVLNAAILHFAAVSKTGNPGKLRLHIKVDTGLGRGGFAEDEWQQLFESLASSLRGADIEFEGLFSHLSNTSPAEDLAQQQKFEEALALAAGLGLRPNIKHLAATAAALSYPGMRYDMVRVGIGVYGLSPDDRSVTELGLRPAMRVSARVANVKRVPAGQGVSYNYRYRTRAETTLVLVPFGYAEGMPRISSGASVKIGAGLFQISGQVAMDQFVVDVGDQEVLIGDEVVIFGDPALGEPSAEALGASAQSINYEVVTRIGGRAHRSYVGGKA